MLTKLSVLKKLNDKKTIFEFHISSKYITIKYYVIRHTTRCIAARHRYVMFLWRFIQLGVCTLASGYNCRDFILGSSYIDRKNWLAYDFWHSVRNGTPLNHIVHGITTNTIPGTSNVEARKNCFRNTNTQYRSSTSILFAITLTLLNNTIIPEALNTNQAVPYLYSVVRDVK